MSLLEIENLTHSYGDHLLYKNVSFALNPGEHIGIVGQNGSGKSTFIKLCTRQLMPDIGRVIPAPRLTLGYLDQYAVIDDSLTLGTFLGSAFEILYQMESAMLHLYDADAESLRRAANYQDELERRGFYTIDTQIERTVQGLGLAALGLNHPIGEMSGGQRAKAILAKLLLTTPDVLLLDEPTNFLDREHILWLGEYLANLDNAFMVVSHDHAFLDCIANRICDIDGLGITKYYGGYSDFLKKKTLLRADQLRQYTAQQREIAKTEAFIRKNIAGRKSKMARGRQKQLDRLERIDGPSRSELRPHFEFSPLPLTDTEHLRIQHLSVGYDYPVLSRIAFTLKGGQKAVLTGFNGIGKSTLIKTLLGQLPVLEGGFTLSPQVRLAYFEQDLAWENGERTPLQILADAQPKLPPKALRQNLARCGITSEHALQAISTLSGGEQAKVKLCLLTLTPCNFLVLDEPTNHLDTQAKAALQEALMTFPGTVLLVSHEEAFYKGWAQPISLTF
ncbi:MAG: ABC-F family ATP-binding cassette domain-containing protein [Eubacterium sp.]